MPRNRRNADKPAAPSAPVGQTTQPIEIGKAITSTGDEVFIETGDGNMSAAELVALRQEIEASGGVPVTEGEAFTAADAPVEQASKEEISLGARVATLEHRMKTLEGALEKWAAAMNERPIMAAIPQQMATVTVPATEDEKVAYCKTNFALSQQGQPGHDGIQAWRDAGSPRLEPKPAGKAA